MLTRKQKFFKRIFDISLTVIVLPFAIIPLFLLLVVATVTLGKNGLFAQTRIGQFGVPFKLYKIRTLKGSKHKDIIAIKSSEMWFGRWLRKTKLDELPQLFNVLKGDMSWVGPRPDIAGYADTLGKEDRLILSVRPGITGPATLKYKYEDTLLLQQENPLHYNDTVIWPDKVRINKKYVQEYSLGNDIRVVLASFFR